MIIQSQGDFFAKYVMANSNIDTSPTESNEDSLEESQFLKLPIEIIRNILLYVDDRSRSNVALVCQLFYELICELERDKNPLDLCYTEVIFLSCQFFKHFIQQSNDF